ncbi:type 4a pilus biogenesis protein PilO [bacterium]|nr:type 4a pilus biogenesis protein PilO [bacterium]
MNLTPEQKKIIMRVIVVGALGLGVIFWYWMMFGRAELESAEKGFGELEAQYDELAEEQRTINEFKAMTEGQWDEIEQTIAQASKRLPQTRESQGFLIALRNILQITGINTLELSPRKVAEYDRFAEIPYGILARGRFHEIGHFLNLVEQNPDRFMRVKTLEVDNDLDRPSLHPIKVQIATFMLISN